MTETTDPDELVFNDEGVAAHPSKMQVSRLPFGDRWHFAIDSLSHDFSVDLEHEAALTISSEDAVDLARELLRFAPEPEPVAWMDSDGDTWEAGAKEDAEKYGPLTPLYAHPPVPAEAATDPQEATVDAFARACLVTPDAARTYLDALAGAGYSVVPAEAATAPSETAPLWMKGALEDAGAALEEIRGTNCHLSDVGRYLREWVSEHEPNDPEMWAGAATRAEARVRELEAEVKAEREGAHRDQLAEWEKELLRDAEVQDLRAEVERYKAALEAAEAVITSIKAEAERRDAWHESKWTVAVAKDEMNAARDYAIWCTEQYDAARAALASDGEVQES